jgi:hypothetical protein
LKIVWKKDTIIAVCNNRKVTLVGEIIIEEVNYKSYAITFTNIVLLMASITLTIIGVIQDKKGYLVVGILASMFLFLTFVVVRIKVSNIKRLLTITMDGIIDNSSTSSMGFISYNDIKEFKIITLSNNKNAIAVIPKNLDALMSKMNPAKRRQIKRNVHLNLPPIAVMVDRAKDMEPEDILSLLQKRLSDYSRLYE